MCISASHPPDPPPGGPGGALLAEWTGAAEGADAGVDLGAAFRRAAGAGEGPLRAAGVAALLEDLGLEPTAERLAAALDAGGGEDLSREAFEAWWRAPDAFVLLRSEPQPPKPTKPTKPAKATKPAKPAKPPAAPPVGVVVARTAQTALTVRGLLPNSVYHFALRRSGARAASYLSTPLVVATRPARPGPPVLVARGPRHAWLRWYPPPGGAEKYRLEARPEAPARREGGGWRAAYEGPEGLFCARGLLPGAAHLFRVAGVSGGGAGEPSAALRVEEGGGGAALRPSNAGERFTRDCEGGAAVGDTLLFQERIGGGGGGAGGRVDMGGGTGERTVAARALRRFGRGREESYQLQVLWSTLSDAVRGDDRETHAIAPQAVIERRRRDIFRFEVFRTPWEQEEGRRPD